MRWRRTVTGALHAAPMRQRHPETSDRAAPPLRRRRVQVAGYSGVQTARLREKRPRGLGADRLGRSLGRLLRIPTGRFGARFEKVAGDAGQCTHADQEAAFIDEKARRVIGWRLVDVGSGRDTNEEKET